MEPGGAAPRPSHDRRLLPRPPPLPRAAAGVSLASSPRWCSLLVVTITPLETIAMNYLLVIHLLQNVVLAEWAPLLVVLGLPPALAATLAEPRFVRTLTHPAVALPLWLANYMLWHLPWLYDTALENPHTLLHLEHALYFATGSGDVVERRAGRAASARHGDPRRRRLRRLHPREPDRPRARARPDAVYDFYVDAPERLWGSERARGPAARRDPDVVRAGSGLLRGLHRASSSASSPKRSTARTSTTRD